MNKSYLHWLNRTGAGESKSARAGRGGRRRKSAARRRTARFEPLESREMLAVDLGFAGAFSLLNPPASGVNSTNAPFDISRGGGMVSDAAGNRYVTINGTFYSGSLATTTPQSVDLDPGAGVLAATIDAAVVKLDPNNNVLWTAPLTATGSNAPVVRVSVAVDANQNVYMVGDFRGTIDVDPSAGVVNVTSTAGGTDYGFYMAKLNSAGQLQWVRTLAATELTPYRVAVDGAGNLLVGSNFTGGTSDPPMDVDAGPGQTLMQSKTGYDLVTLKYDTNGNFVWGRQIGNAGADMFGDNPILSANDQGDVFVSGSFQGTLDLDPGTGVHNATDSEAAKHCFLVHLDSAGNFVSSYTTEGTGSASIRDIEFAGDGSLVLGGYFSGTPDFQPGSGTLSITSVASHDGFVLKLNSDSSVAWVKQFGGLGETIPSEADVDSAGNIYLAGSFGRLQQAGQSADFDPGPGVYNVYTPSTNETAFVLSLTSAGDFRWAVPLGGNTGRSQVQGLSVTPTGDVQISGGFQRTGDFDPNPVGESWLTSSGQNQTVFTATLKQSAPNPGAPVVDAGADQTILVTGTANLDGSVTDDGLPAPVTSTWSFVSGPGSVTFGNASALDTTASFSTSGNYLLALTASDTQFTTVDYVHVFVNPLTASLTATADTYIDNGNATTNYGAAATLAVSGKPDEGALLQWDLSSIPAGSTLQSATLSINVTGASSNSYEIYALNRSWTESQATWKLAAKKTNWQTAGAQGSLDRGATLLGTVIASATGARNVVLNAAGLAVVQGWLNNPATNFGFVIQDYTNSNKDDLVFSSKEATVAGNRPQLQVVYNPPSTSRAAFKQGGMAVGAAGAAAASSAGVVSQDELIHSTTSLAPAADFSALDLLLANRPANGYGTSFSPGSAGDEIVGRANAPREAAVDAALATAGDQFFKGLKSQFSG